MAFRSDSNPELAWFEGPPWHEAMNLPKQRQFQPRPIDLSAFQVLGPTRLALQKTAVALHVSLCVCLSYISRWQYHIHVDSKHCSWLGLQAMEPAPALPMLLCKVFFFQTLANVRNTLAHMSLVNTLAHALPSVQGFPCQLGFRGLSVQWPLQSSQKNYLYRTSSCSIL